MVAGLGEGSNTVQELFQVVLQGSEYQVQAPGEVFGVSLAIRSQRSQSGLYQGVIGLDLPLDRKQVVGPAEGNSTICSSHC